MPPLAECRLLRGDRLPAGERALAATARALMGQPDIVLFDAVAEGLASAFRSNLWDAVRIGAAAGVAWIIADAPLDEVGLETQRHVVMSRGEIVFDGSTGALKSDAALVRRHLGV
jgi:branched-chain amino acid transport system ATP-binding protein